MNREGVSFVISSPRSGTTWLQKLLSNLPKVVCVESRAYGSFFEMWPDSDGVHRPRITIDAFAGILSKYVTGGRGDASSRDAFVLNCTKAILEAIHRTVREASGSVHVVEKITPYLGTSVQVLEGVQRDFPEAAVLQLVRDGRDVVTSGVFHWINRNAKGTERHSCLVERTAGRMRRFFDDEELVKWCQYWREPIEAFARCGKQRPVVRYEDLKEDLAACICKLIGELSLPDCSEEIIVTACQNSSFQKMSGGRVVGEAVATSHVRKGIVGDWRNYFTRRDGEIFVEETRDLLLQCGYEIDESWVSLLPKSLDVRVPSRSILKRIFGKV